MASNDILLIIGAGPRLGKSVASTFATNGYRVAVAARSVSPGISDEGILSIKTDLANPSLVPLIFQTVEKEWGAPNVVVYNGANRLTTPPDDPLSASLETIADSRTVGFDSAYIAAQEALRRFRNLPDSTPKAFIFTGNTLNQIAIPGVIPFAIGKVSSAMMIEYAANAYGKHGFRFYYTDERQPNGLPAGMDVDGPAHAKLYWELANEKSQSKWLVTFTKQGGRQFQNFLGVDFQGNTRGF